MKREKSLQGLKLKGGVLLLMSVGSLFPQMALATSAGTILRNSVSVTYEDNAAVPNSYSASDSVDVTVDLVGSVAWGSVPTGQTVGQGDQLSPAYTTTLTNTGNGSDTYTLADTTVQTCDPGDSLTAQSFSLVSSVASLTLGATVSSGVATTNTVPNPDQTTIPVSNLVSGANGFDTGDTVIINGLPYIVVSATENAIPTSTDTLIIEDEGGVAAAFITGAGEQIGEQAVITYGGGGTAGTLGDVTDVCQHDHTLTATGATPNDNPAAFDDITGWATVVEAVDVTVTKYVRNSSPGSTKNPGAGGVQYNGAGPFYFASGVTGNPGDTLEYLVVIENTSNADAVNVVFSDILPAFTSYVTSSLAVDTDGDGSFDQDTTSDESEADDELVDPSIIVQSGQNIDVYPGVGGDEDGPGTGGTVSDNSKTAVRYSVTID